MYKLILRLIFATLLLTVFYNGLFSHDKSSHYYSENVTFQSNDVTLAGTITIPKSDQPCPALILISVGGNRDRNAQHRGFKPFKLIAEYLSERGFIILRFDDRGVGESTGQNSLEATLDDFKIDALSAVEYLKSRNEIIPSKIGLLGHCAGAYACLKAARETDDIAFLITMAGYGLDGVETLLDGTRRQLIKKGLKENEIQKAVQLESQLYDAMFTHRDFSEIELQMRAKNLTIFENLPDDKKKRYKNFDDYFSKSSDGYLLGYAKTHYFLEALKAKPIPYYAKLTIPALLMFGENDLSVHPDAHISPIVEALEKADNTHYEIKIIPGANQYFVAE